MKGIKVFVGRVMLVALFALAASLVLTGGAWAKTVGGFAITPDSLQEGTDYTYTAAGPDYALEHWGWRGQV